MDSYFEIKALPNPEMLQTTIVGYLMESLHHYLSDTNGNVGLSFPGYGQQRTLGGILRVISKRDDLEGLYDEICFDPVLNDYALITEINEVPSKVIAHYEYKRIHPKGNSHFERLKRRYQQRGDWDESKAENIAKKLIQPTRLPHIFLNSLSTGQKYPLFIKEKYHQKPQDGTFNSYGLSLNGATVPGF